MRTIYLILGVFVLMGVGAACRTPALVPADCAEFVPGLAQCPPQTATPGD